MEKRSREMLVHALLEALRQKGQLNNIEKDIMSTVDVLYTIPFNREKAELKIKENNIKYPEIYASMKMVPQVIEKPIVLLSDQEMEDNLLMQIEALCIKDNIESH